MSKPVEVRGYNKWHCDHLQEINSHVSVRRNIFNAGMSVRIYTRVFLLKGKHDASQKGCLLPSGDCTPFTHTKHESWLSVNVIQARIHFSSYSHL